MATGTPFSTDTSPETVSSAVVVPTESLVASPILNLPSSDSSNKRPRPSSSSSRQFNKDQPEELKRPRLNTDNPETKKRNQRLFGMILGTLHQSKADDAKKRETIEKRAEIDRRLQAKLAKEKEDIAQLIKEEQKQRAETDRRLQAKFAKEKEAIAQLIEGERKQRGERDQERTIEEIKESFSASDIYIDNVKVGKVYYKGAVHEDINFKGKKSRHEKS